VAVGKSTVEDLGMKQFSGRYQGAKVLLTGHTGFKGSWLSCWLSELGALVVGIALPPATSPNHWDLLNLDIPQHLIDIRNGDLLARVVSRERPEIVFHLAAQPIVRRSYCDPLETWSTNVIGTANLLEACRHVDSVRAIVVITTDKVYENREWLWAYRENERLGGHDPYSASKAASELVVASYRKSYFHAPGASLLATARAGNVIGGGDWSEDRLIPDLVRSIGSGSPLMIRFPEATRPWQHVLECLSGYLLLGQMLLDGRSECADAWNFGPDFYEAVSVNVMLTRLKMRWPEIVWQTNDQPQPHEAGLLSLDSSKARVKLGWRPVWKLDDALNVTADWYRAYLAEGHLQSRLQIATYVDRARSAGLAWSGI
jgi:CDP-glucose 4,6-dehydratase